VFIASVIVWSNWMWYHPVFTSSVQCVRCPPCCWTTHFKMCCYRSLVFNCWWH